MSEFNPKLSEVELAYQLLKSAGQPRNYRDIIQEVFQIKGLPADNHQLMASVHTQINLDNRFVYQGKGIWSLKEWTQEKVVRRMPLQVVGRAPVPVKRRSLQDEFDTEDGEYSENYDANSYEEDDEWEE